MPFQVVEDLEGEEKQEQLPRLFALSAGDQPEFVQEAMPYQAVARLTGREGEWSVERKRKLAKGLFTYILNR